MPTNLIRAWFAKPGATITKNFCQKIWVYFIQPWWLGGEAVALHSFESGCSLSRWIDPCLRNGTVAVIITNNSLQWTRYLGCVLFKEDLYDNGTRTVYIYPFIFSLPQTT